MVQGVQFVVDLYHLNIAAADIVFGLTWLQSLGHVITDYHLNTMEFIYDGQSTILYAANLLQMQPLHGSGVKKMVHSNNILAVCHLQLQAATSSADPITYPAPVQQLL